MDNSSVSTLHQAVVSFAMRLDRHSIDTPGDVWKVIHHHFREKSVVYTRGETDPNEVCSYVWDSVDGWLPMSFIV